jgi:hypothetical protein
VRNFSWNVTWKLAARRFDSAMYRREFDRTSRLAGMASFQLSPEKTALVREKKSDVAGMEGGAALETS